MPWAENQAYQASGGSGQAGRAYINYNPLQRQPTAAETANAGQTQRLGMLAGALGGGGFGGMGGGFSSSPGTIGKVNTSITPSPIYSADQTAQAANQARAAAQMQADPNFAMKQFDRGGVSRSAGTLRAALPNMMQAQNQAAWAPAQQQLQDSTVNAKQMLQGEVARENEALGLAGLLGRQSAFNQSQRTQDMMPFLSYLSQMLAPTNAGSGGGFNDVLTSGPMLSLSAMNQANEDRRKAMFRALAQQNDNNDNGRAANFGAQIGGFA